MCMTCSLRWLSVHFFMTISAAHNCDLDWLYRLLYTAYVIVASCLELVIELELKYNYQTCTVVHVHLYRIAMSGLAGL